MSKKVSFITRVSIHPAKELWPHQEGKFFARGIITSDPVGRFSEGDDIRTSLILNINIEKGFIETMNTIYYIE